MKIAAVLRTGGLFDDRHAAFLERQVRQHYPDSPFELYRDVSTLPKWWAKFDIARDTSAEPILVLDLDTVILKSVPIPTDRPYVMRDFRGVDQMACGMMLWTPDFRQQIAEHFFRNPRRFMAEANWDDQKYFGRYWGTQMGRFQDVMPPDSIVSYKLTTQYFGLRPGNAFVFFHGEPRPWDLDLPWIPKL